MVTIPYLIPAITPATSYCRPERSDHNSPCHPESREPATESRDLGLGFLGPRSLDFARASTSLGMTVGGVGLPRPG